MIYPYFERNEKFMEKNQILENIKNTTMDLINFDTYTGNSSALEALFNYVKPKMKDFNIIEKVIQYDNHDYHNLIISNTTDKELDIIFCCHVDVVPANEYKAHVEGNKLYGRGAIDMKGQTAVVMELLNTVKTTKKVAFILTSDEEIGGLCCREIMKEYNSKLAILPDGGSNFELIVEEKGLLQVELSATGVAVHGSEPFKGDNAVIKLIKLYDKLIEMYPMPTEEEYNLSITLSKFHGGDANNKVPDFATMNLDVRYTKKDNIEEFINYLKNYSKDISVKILDLEPVFYVDETLEIMQQFIKNCTEVLGREPKITRCCAGSDAPYFSEKNIPVIIMNPSGKNWHGINEYVEIDSLYTLYKIFKNVL